MPFHSNKGNWCFPFTFFISFICCCFLFSFFISTSGFVRIGKKTPPTLYYYTAPYVVVVSSTARLNVCFVWIVVVSLISLSPPFNNTSCYLRLPNIYLIMIMYIVCYSLDIKWSWSSWMNYAIIRYLMHIALLLLLLLCQRVPLHAVLVYMNIYLWNPKLMKINSAA